MDRAAGFAADHAHQARMGISERVDGDAAEKIQILLAVGVIQMAPAPVRKHHRRTLIGVHQMLRSIQTNFGRRGRPRRGFLSLFWHSKDYSVARWAAFATRTTGRTRVPGTRPPFAAASSARGWVPPTI